MPKSAEHSTPRCRSRVILLVTAVAALTLMSLTLLVQDGVEEAAPWLVGLFATFGASFATAGRGCCWRRKRRKPAASAASAAGRDERDDEGIARWPSP